MTQKTVCQTVSTRINRRRRVLTSNVSVNGGDSGMYICILRYFGVQHLFHSTGIKAVNLRKYVV